MTFSNRNRNIILSDMILDWISHWRSLFAMILASCLAGLILMNTSDLMSLNPENSSGKVQTTTSSIEESGYTGLSGSELYRVNELVTHYKEFKAIDRAITDVDSKLALQEKAEAYSKNIQTGYYIYNMVNGLNENQKKLFYSRVMKDNGPQANDLMAGESSKEESSRKTDMAEQPQKGKKAYLLMVVLAVFVHAMISCGFYIFNDRLKVADHAGTLIGCADISKTVNWDRLNKKNLLDRIVSVARVRNEKKIPYKEAQAINANIVLTMMRKYDIGSLVIIYGNLKDQAEELAEMIMRESGEISVDVASSLVGSEKDSQKAAATDGVIMLAKACDSSLSDLWGERMSLLNLRVNLMGVITYVSP